MKIIKFESKDKVEENECSEVAKELYEAAKSGVISGFMAVTLDKENDSTLFIGNNENDRKSILHFLGAVWMLNHQALDILDENSIDD